MVQTSGRSPSATSRVVIRVSRVRNRDETRGAVSDCGASVRSNIKGAVGLPFLDAEDQINYSVPSVLGTSVGH